MSKLMACGTCCAILSIWGSLQLLIMGIMFKMECSVLIHDVRPHETSFKSYQAFLDQVSENYKEVSINCFIAAGIYAVTLILSILCCVRARRSSGGASIKSCEFLDVEGGTYSVKIPSYTLPGQGGTKPRNADDNDDLNETRELRLKRSAAETKKAEGMIEY